MIKYFNSFNGQIFVECLLYAKDCNWCLVYIGEQNRQRYLPSQLRVTLYSSYNKEVDCMKCDELLTDMGGNEK